MVLPCVTNAQTTSLYTAPRFNSEEASKEETFNETTCMAREKRRIPPKLGRMRPHDILAQNRLNGVETKRAPAAPRMHAPRKNLEKGKTGLNHIQG